MFQSLLCEFMLQENGQPNSGSLRRLLQYILELVQLVLPTAIQLQAHLHAAEDHLLAPFEIYPQLDDIPVVNREGFRLLARRAQPYVIQKGAAAALHIPYVPLAVFVPEFAVASAYDF